MSRKKYISWPELLHRLDKLVIEGIIKRDDKVYGVPKGGMIVAGFLADRQRIELTATPQTADVILDDIVDSGATRAKYETKYPHSRFIGVVDKTDDVEFWNWGTGDEWIVFPWEADHPGGEDTVHQNIIRILQYLGEKPDREGLIDTPNRVVKSWAELYAGYSQKPEDVLTAFDSDGYDQIVLLRDIELYSTCEHHMLPFYGKAHVAYIPDKKVIGISKLARLVDIYARRLQIQERIGEQVTGALMDHLKPLGAACMIEAQHMCMCARGVGKQHSTMTTSSIRGAFAKDSAARAELITMIR